MGVLQLPWLGEMAAKEGEGIEIGNGETEEKTDENKAPAAANKLGWMEGVFMPCLLNIWGVMLFLRLTWVIGQAGIVQGLLLMTIANVVTTITTLSMSAVCTNGQIKGGGVYYMISRSLGPEFGGAIGLMFTLANSIAVAMYVIGFCESLLDMLNFYVEDFQGITGTSPSQKMNDVRIIGLITLTLALALAIVGMEWVTRVQKALLFLLIGSQIDFCLGTFFSSNIAERAKGFTGWSMETAEQNMHPNYQGESFWTVFSVFFPAVTGIVAGANLSGDLKDPATAIHKGTLGAIVLTYVTYVVYGIMVGCTYLSAASGSILEYNATISGTTGEGILRFDDCFSEDRTETCESGTVYDQQTMATISVTGYLIYGGCFAATLSSAIASLVGAPRVLQALAKDKLYPGIESFSRGYGANDDPVRGYILVFFISVVCIIIGDLNVVSGLLSNFFVASYALINFSAFHASATKSPGWRPSFGLYNPWVSLFGTFLCVAVMFLMGWVTAIITIVIIGILYMWIHYRKPEANWGSSTQAAVFVNALKSVQSLTDTPEHVKNYRPKLLVLSGNPTHRIPLLDFGNLITKKLSLLVTGHVITDNTQKNTTKLREEIQDWMKKTKINGFYNVLQNKSFEDGAQACLALTGLGKLAPNMLLMGFKSDWNKDVDRAIQYVNVWNKAYDQQLSVIVLRVKGGLDYSSHIVDEELIDPEDTHPVLEKDSEKETNGGPKYDRKVSVEAVGKKEVSMGKKKVSVDRAQVSKLGQAINILVFGGNQPVDVLADIKQFQDKKRRGNIDIWWLYDDGGLPILLSHVLQSRQQFEECKLRVFTLGSEKLDRQSSVFDVFSKNVEKKMETKDMEELLSKFRIAASDVTVISQLNSRAAEKTWDEFKSAMNGAQPQQSAPTEADIENESKFINKHLKLGEMLQKHSKDSQMILMTLPQDRLGTANPIIYMGALDFMTRNLPPLLLVGGNNTSALTFHT